MVLPDAHLPSTCKHSVIGSVY